MKFNPRALLYFLFICIPFSNAFCQGPLVKEWDYSFGGTISAYLQLSSLLQASDHGYLLGGWTASDSGNDVSQRPRGGYDYWIVKTDSMGIKQWDKRFGGNFDDYLRQVHQTSDGGYILGGYTYSDSAGDVSAPNKDGTHAGKYDYWIVKTDSSGTKTWDKRFGGYYDDYLYALQQTPDHGYILGGYTLSDSSADVSQHKKGHTDFWLVKTDSLGIKQWDKRYGGDYNANIIFTTLELTADNGYILGGYTNADSVGDISENRKGATDYWILKTDSAGNKQWDKRYGGNKTDWLYSLHQTRDGGYILGGTSNSDSSGDKTQAISDTNTLYNPRDYWIVKTDPLGNKQWDKKFGGLNTDFVFDNIIQLKDGGYLIGGSSYSNASGDKSENNLGREQSWMIRTDSSGNKLWDKTIFVNSGTSDNSAGYALQSNDGSYVIANWTSANAGGYKSQPRKGFIDYWIVKFRDTSSVATTFQESNLAKENVNIYPNPSSTNIFHLAVTDGLLGSTLQVYDGSERVVLESTINQQRFAIVLNAGQGVYFIRISSPNVNIVKKLVKL